MHLLFLTEQNGICYYLMNIKEIKGEYYEEKNYCLRFASYKINVPSDKLDDFLDESSKLATVRNKSTSAEDITAQYYDNESRLKSLQIQEERYLEILKTATEVKDIIEIENALTDVRYEIENLTTCLNKISNLVDMATVNINIRKLAGNSGTISTKDIRRKD